MDEIPTEILSETENYSVWASQEPDGELTFHIEIGSVTIHFFDEEWQEFLELVRGIPADSGQGSGTSPSGKK